MYGQLFNKVYPMYHKNKKDGVKCERKVGVDASKLSIVLC